MKRDDQLKEDVLEMYEAVSNGNEAYLENFLAKDGDVLCIGTDEKEIWSERNVIIDSLKSQATSGTKIVHGNIKAYSEGSIGWVVDEPKFVVADGREAKFRMTSVFHLEQGKWKLIQTHASKGIPNSELFK